MEFKISSPCPVSWDTMAGNDKIRHCSRCRLNVYNLEEMGREEIAAVVRKTGGQLCGRLYVRADRMATLRDCPRGGFQKRLRRALMVTAILALAGFAWMLKPTGDRDRSMHPAWIQTVLNWIDPEPPRYELGRVLCK